MQPGGWGSWRSLRRLKFNPVSTRPKNSLSLLSLTLTLGFNRPSETCDFKCRNRGRAPAMGRAACLSAPSAPFGDKVLASSSIYFCPLLPAGPSAISEPHPCRTFCPICKSAEITSSARNEHSGQAGASRQGMWGEATLQFS